MVRVPNTCEDCGTNDAELVRQCCAWEGNKIQCPSCRRNPEKLVPYHVCGVGLQYPKGHPNNGGSHED